jgi:14-3-3 protein epsilon
MFDVCFDGNFVLKLVRNGFGDFSKSPFGSTHQNAIGVRRAAWRMMKAVEDAERSKADLNAAHVELAQKARRKIEAELTTLAQSCCNLIEQQLMPRVDGDEQRVFYLKMTGDYNRYMCEYMDGDARTTALNASRAAYQVDRRAFNERI